MDAAIAPLVRVLGDYRPSQYQSEVIEVEIKPFLPPCCRRERVSVRIPMGIAPHPDNLEWHQDGGGPAGTVRHMVVWASEQPTELQLPDGSVLIPDPFAVVWFDNDHAYHRQPAATRPADRWFVSIRCSGAT